MRDLICSFKEIIILDLVALFFVAKCMCDYRFNASEAGDAHNEAYFNFLQILLGMF